MSNQLVTSALFVELSTDEQQLLTGGEDLGLFIPEDGDYYYYWKLKERDKKKRP